MLNFRGLILTVLMVNWAFLMNAQFTVRNRPYWIENTPVAGRDAGFYYFVTSAEGVTIEAAYQNAYSMAVLSFRSRMGNVVTASVDTVVVESQQMRVRINQACMYSEDVLEANRIRVYVLWQIAKSFTIDPGFEEFNQCYKPKTTEKPKKSKNR